MPSRSRIAGHRSRRPRALNRRVVRKSVSVANYKVPRSIGSYRGEFTIRKMRFALNEGATHSMTSASGGLSSDFVYRANDLFDPYAGAGGQQPRTFDQIISMYRNFVVLGSKITVNLGFGSGSATSSDMLLSIIMKDGSAAVGSPQDVLESSRRRYTYITANADRRTLVAKYSWKINGTKDALENHNMWGTAGASPLEQWYYHIIAYCPGGESETAKFTGYIDYTAVFFHAILPTAS